MGCEVISYARLTKHKAVLSVLLRQVEYYFQMCKSHSNKRLGFYGRLSRIWVYSRQGRFPLYPMVKVLICWIKRRDVILS